MRQMFLLSIGLSVFVGVLGALLAMQVSIPGPTGDPIYFNWSGTIVVVASSPSSSPRPPTITGAATVCWLGRSNALRAVAGPACGMAMARLWRSPT